MNLVGFMLTRLRVLESGDRWSWWTFAGAKANATLAYYLAQELKSTVSSDGFSMKFSEGVTSEQIESSLATLDGLGPEQLRPVANEKATKGLKFSECLSQRLADQVTSMRLRDDAAIDAAISDQIRVVIPPAELRLKPALGSRKSHHATLDKPNVSRTIQVGNHGSRARRFRFRGTRLAALSVFVSQGRTDLARRKDN